MGCAGHKPSAPNGAQAPTKATLLDVPSQKVSVDTPCTAQEEDQRFTIFLSSLGGSECFALVGDVTTLRVKDGVLQRFAPAGHATTLHVKDVDDGPISLWNTRGHEIVKKGDLVVKVRKACMSEAQWMAGDAKKMLEFLSTDGPFELEIQRGTALEAVFFQEPPTAPAASPTAQTMSRPPVLEPAFVMSSLEALDISEDPRREPTDVAGGCSYCAF